MHHQRVVSDLDALWAGMQIHAFVQIHSFAEPDLVGKTDTGQSKEWRIAGIFLYMEIAVEIGEPAFRQAKFVSLT